MQSMLVSHKFVDLLYMIRDDHTFDKALFDALSETERDFLAYILKRSKIESREFSSAYNQTISHLVDRLNMLHNASKIGDDNPSIKKEMTDILDELYAKGVFSNQYYMQFKRSLARP
jgi:predicted transcriptional regulator YheO